MYPEKNKPNRKMSRRYEKIFQKRRKLEWPK